MKKIKKFRINIREKKVLQLLKYNEDITQEEPFLKLTIKKEIQASYKFIKPATVYSTFDLEEINTLIKDSNDVKELLKDTNIISLFIVTIGDDLEQEVQTLLEKNEVARAAILDAIGSEAVEQSANFVNRLLREEAKLENFELTPRFSPGYGDWDIKTNIELLNVLNSDKVDVKVKESGMLIPQKSITAIIGWIKNQNHEKK